MKKKALVLSIVNVVLAIATIVVNILANALPLNGKNTGVLSDQYPNLFVPAGLTFSIWGLIYVLFLVYVVYHFVVSVKDPRQAENYVPSLVAFALSCVLNMGWIFAWHYEKVGLSVVIMMALLVTLLFIFTFQRRQKIYGQISLAAVIPIDVYAGWITVATIANITAWLVKVGWNGWGIAADVWTMLMMSIGALIGIIVLLRYQALAYAAVIVWAYLGIILKRSASTPVYQNIIMTAWVTILLIVIMMLQSAFVLWMQKRKS